MYVITDTGNVQEEHDTCAEAAEAIREWWEGSFSEFYDVPIPDFRELKPDEDLQEYADYVSSLCVDTLEEAGIEVFAPDFRLEVTIEEEEDE